jgi:hypothetical protein
MLNLIQYIATELKLGSQHSKVKVHGCCHHGRLRNRGFVRSFSAHVTLTVQGLRL